MQPNKNSRYESDRQASDEEEKKPNTNEEEKEKESLKDNIIVIMEQQHNTENLNTCNKKMRSPQQIYQLVRSQDESDQLTLTIQKIVNDLSKLFSSLTSKSSANSRPSVTSVAVKQKPSRARQQQSLEELKFKSSDSIGKGLCTSLKLKTSSEKSIKQLTQDLSVFYYNRVTPTQIGISNVQYLKKVQKDIYRTHSSLINVMKLFFDSKNVNDRVYFIRKNETILFGTEQNEKFGLIVCDSWRNSKCWAEQAVHLIPFELETNGPYNKKFGGIVKNKAVFHFFNLCINSLMKKDAKYQMIVNYPVVGCTQIHPNVKYQQHDDDEKYGKSALIQGYLFAEHIEKIKQKLGSENVFIQTNCYKYSDLFQKSIRDALSESISDYQDYQDSQGNQIRQDTQESLDSQEERFSNENENQKEELLKKIRRQMVNELMQQDVCERQRQKISIDYDEFFHQD